MFDRIRRRKFQVAALAGATFAALGITVASSQATTGASELPKSTPQNVMVASLDAGAMYRASLISPTPTMTPSTRGWKGSQFVSRAHGRCATRQPRSSGRTSQGVRSTSSPGLP